MADLTKDIEPMMENSENTNPTVAPESDFLSPDVAWQTVREEESAQGIGKDIVPVCGAVWCIWWNAGNVCVPP